MRICVYTVALNEKDEVADWLAATSDADQRLVLDTGSTDGTDQLLQAAGVIVHHGMIKPWRFDDAFNTALILVPSDIDVVFRVDMDERPHPGWRGAIEAAFDETVTLLRYRYQWSDTSCFYSDRVHRRHGYRWKGPTHEGLVWRGDIPENQKFLNDTLVVDHFQKPKTRPVDMTLLQEAVAEYPNDSRLCLYYARELAFYQRPEAIGELRRFQGFSLTNADRAYSYRLLASVDEPNRLDHLGMAYQIEPSASADLALAAYYYAKDEWQDCYRHVTQAIAGITEIGTWTDDMRLHTAYPYDVASVAAWNLGDVEMAKRHVLEAFRRDPLEQRIADNVVAIHRSKPPELLTHP